MKMIKIYFLIKVSENYGINGFIVSNTYIGEANGMSGGISGNMLKEKSLNMLKSKFTKEQRYNINFFRGISSKDDVKERIENGADLIQIYTSFVYRGPSILDELIN